MHDLTAELQGVRTLGDISARLLYSIDQGEVPDRLRSRFVRRPVDLICQPTTIEQIQQVLRAATNNRVPVVLRGSASSAFGAVLPTRGGLGVDLSWLRRILRVDQEKQTATVEAGVRWSDLANNLKGSALRTYPTNIFSTVAGWIATGGYGIGSAKYGHLSEQIESIRVILPDGSDQTYTPQDREFSYFFGADGQLGVVVEVTLKLREPPKTVRPVLMTFDSNRAAIEFLRHAFASGVRPFYGNFWTEARMREKNHLAKRQDFLEQPTLLLVVESPEQENKILELGGKPVERWKAMLCWEDRYFPIRAKQLGPGLLAAELVFPHALVPDYIDVADAVGRKYGREVVVEAQIVGPETSVVIASYLFDSRDPDEHYAASAFAMKLAAEGLHLGAKPYNLGLWYGPFAKMKFGERFRELKAFKRRVDPLGLFNPDKSLSSPFFYRTFLKAFAMFPWLPPWFKSRRPHAHEAPTKYDWKTAWEVCSKCAACVAHCPAYLAFGDERVTARGKMFMLANLDAIPAEEAKNVMLCMHCKACTEVCQSQIQLEDAFFDLEKIVTDKHGKDDEKISGFLNRVAELRLMEDLPMARREPRWVSRNIDA